MPEATWPPFVAVADGVRSKIAKPTWTILLKGLLLALIRVVAKWVLRGRALRDQVLPFASASNREINLLMREAERPSPQARAVIEHPPLRQASHKASLRPRP